MISVWNLGEKWQSSMSRLTDPVRLWLEKIWREHRICLFYLYYEFIYTIRIMKHTLFIELHQVRIFCFSIRQIQSKQAEIVKGNLGHMYLNSLNKEWSCSTIYHVFLFVCLVFLFCFKIHKLDHSHIDKMASNSFKGLPCSLSGESWLFRCLL